MNVRQLLFETPTLELLRGRVGRLAWKRRLKASGLATEVQNVIRRIAGQWRLFRRERARIADELIAHFQDGGTLADFGDVGAARKLFRKTMIAKRGWWWPVCKGVAIAVVLVVGYYGLLTIRYHMGRPIVETDYAAKLGVPLVETALLSDVPSALQLAVDRIDNETWNAAEGWGTDDPIPPLPEQYRIKAELVAEQVGLREDLRRLAALDEPLLYVRYRGANDPIYQMLIGILLPDLNYARDAANMLDADARHAMRMGDLSRTIENAVAILGIARRAADENILVSNLVAAGIDTMGFVLIADLLQEAGPELSRGDLQLLAHQVATCELGRQFNGERWMLLDVIQRMYTPGDNGRATPESLELLRMLGTMLDSTGQELPSWGTPQAAEILLNAEYYNDALHAPRRGRIEARVNALYDYAIAQAQTPLWNRADISTTLVQRSRSDNLVEAALLGILPSVDRYALKLDHHDALREGLLIGIALELYHRDHDAWPATLDELSPLYLPNLPVDPLSGEALQYRVTDDGPLVYSLGADGDDDGGVAASDVHTGERSMWAAFDPLNYVDDRLVDGDVPLWPPVP